ncbi:MAG: hypothetical protein KGL42_03825 [Betaproteobacteria bacterium]|nr:hypothetical protein [Betaproteobacteria bacterium]
MIKTYFGSIYTRAAALKESYMQIKTINSARKKPCPVLAQVGHDSELGAGEKYAEYLCARLARNDPFLRPEADQISLARVLIEIRGIATRGLVQIDPASLKFGDAVMSARREHSPHCDRKNFNPAEACAAILALADAVHNLPSQGGRPEFLVDSSLKQLTEVARGIYSEGAG